jgi:hypothetical protein
MAAGGFTFAFVRPIAKLFTSWSDTTPPRAAGASCSFAAILASGSPELENPGNQGAYP